MKCVISQREYSVFPGPLPGRLSPVQLASFFQLARETFGLAFQPWYEAGWCTAAYRPYLLFEGDRAVANVSVNTMTFRLDGKKRKLAQLGTVMTAPAYRGRGLARYLMEQALAASRNLGEGVYLYANDLAVSFYRQFGFRQAVEYDFFLDLPEAPPARGNLRQLDLKRPEDLDLFLSLARRGNPFSRCVMEDNPGLLMFYCGDFLCRSLYYAEDADAVLIAQAEEKELLCWDVFGGEQGALPQLLARLAPPEVKTARLGFTPVPSLSCRSAPCREEDQNLMVLGCESLWQQSPLLLPLLSHA